MKKTRASPLHEVPLDAFTGRAAAHRGASLIVVMIIMVIVSLLGISAAQVASMAEHSARNDRDQQVAFQGAETALYDATDDMEGTSPKSRGALFAAGSKVDFIEGCGSTGTSKGLCALEPAGKRIWLLVDFVGATSPTAEFGDFTDDRKFDAGSTGVKPARKPRYIVEAIDDKFTVGSDQALQGAQKLLYRVTAIGFGPRADAQAVVQMLYSKE